MIPHLCHFNCFAEYQIFEMSLTASKVGRDITIVIWNVLLLASSIYKLYFNQTQKVNKLLNYLFLTMLIAVSSSYISLLISRFTIQELESAHHTLFIITILSLYLLALLRLRLSFIDSQFAISAKKIYFHISVIISVIAVAVTAAIFDYLKLYPWHACIYVCCTIIYIIGYSHLTYCFNHNLFLLVLSQKSTVIPTDINNNNTNLNTRQKTLLRTVVQQTLLSCMILVLFIFVVCILIITISVQLKMKEDGTDKLPALGALAEWTIAFVINGTTLCQYMTFAVNAEYYYKICSKCHIRCNHYCQSIAAKPMDIRTSQTLNQLDL